MKKSIFPQKIQAKNLAALVLLSTIICVMSINLSSRFSSGSTEEVQSKPLTTGKINETLKNDKDSTTWLLSGSWNSNLFTNAKFNHTNPAKFTAKINMVMTNGSSPHSHKISHFILSNSSTQDKVTSYNGYLAVSMKLGPVFAIPVAIKNYQNQTISITLNSLDDITLDQAKVINHFANREITGDFAR